MKYLLTLTMVGLMAATAFGDIVADSAAEFSETQTQDGWTNGYYDQTADADGSYSAADFQEFEAPTWIWTGASWDEANVDGDNVPWTTIAADNGHPNGDNNGDVHFAIRRWTSDVSGSATVNYNLAKQNANCGNGTTVLLYHNSDLVAEATVAGGDAAGITGSSEITLASGDILDLALSPLGTDGTLADGCDGSFYGMTVDVVPEPGSFSLIGLAVLGLLSRRRR